MNERKRRRTAMCLSMVAATIATACGLVLDVHDVDYGRAEAIDGVDDGGVLAFEGSVDGDVSLASDASDASDVKRVLTDAECDLDLDGVRSTECGGRDCHDLDPRYQPEAGFSEEIPPAGHDGDWNCDGVVTKELRTNVTFCSFADCAAGGGFSGDPGCGERASYTICVMQVGSCQTKAPVERTQRCR